MSQFSSMEVVMIASVFGLALCLWLGIVLYWARRKRTQMQKMEYRLGLGDASPGKDRILRLWHDGKEVTTTIHEQISHLGISRRLKQIHHDSGLKIPMRAVILSALGGTAAVMMIMMLATNNLVLSIVVSLVVPTALWMLINGRIVRRMAVFESQFVDSLGLAARSLRAGHPLIGSFRLISEEIGEPVGTMFGEIVQQQMLGLSLEQAVQKSAAMSRSSDMRLFATSVLIQLRSGGNLADMMDRLASVVRDRMKLNRRVRVLTAQTQFSKRVLLALPVVMFIVLSLINAKYMEPLYNTLTGQIMLIVAVGLLILGAWLMNRMAVLKY
jgi:tight adherence protein B